MAHFEKFIKYNKLQELVHWTPTFDEGEKWENLTCWMAYIGCDEGVIYRFYHDTNKEEIVLMKKTEENGWEEVKTLTAEEALERRNN